jgi:uncharacterized protein
MTQGRQPEKKNLPPGKRTKTGKARSGSKGDRPSGGAPANKRRPPTFLLLIWALAIVSLISLIYFAGQSRRLPVHPADQGTKRISSGPPRRNDTVPPPPSTPKVSDEPKPVDSLGGIRSPDIPPKVAKVSIVIDDFGPDLVIARQFASLPFPVTLAILPHLAHSREIAQLAHQAGREVILHLPMEPLNGSKKPGPGALMLSMPDDEIRHNIRTALATSPYFDGVNNHMGSRMTRDAQTMKTILSELKVHGLFFIDSMTTNESKGWLVAGELKIPTLKRDVFLDDDPSPDAIRSQIVKLVKIAKLRGTALAIGHPRKATLQSLQQAARSFSDQGIELVTARDLINR